MLSATIKSRLAEMFTAELPEFYDRRIVFWYDEDREFDEAVDELTLDGVTIVKLTGTNNFAIKKLLHTDDLKGNYLIYDPLAYEKDHQDDWLYDIKMYSEEFRADLVSLLMSELHVEPTSSMRRAMKHYAKFFENKERKEKLRRIGRTYQSPLQLHTDIMAVLCGLEGGSAEDVIIAVLSDGLDYDGNDALINIEKFGNIDAFWALVQKFTGFILEEDQPLVEFAAHVLMTALSQTMPSLRGLERFIADSSKAFCYQLVEGWQRGDGREILFDICRTVEHELRLVDRFDNTELDVLLRSDIFPAINESILKRFLSEIPENIVKEKEIIKAVENRRTAAWYDLTEDYFESLYYIAKMQEFYLAHIEGFHIVEATKIWTLYTQDGYIMDSHYRHFHVHFGRTLKAPNSVLEDSLKQSSDYIERLYREWYLKELTQVWTKAIASDLETIGYVSEINRQGDFYRRYVEANASKGIRTFVIVSDALRYEVAAELAEYLNHSTKGKATIESMQSTFPSVTKFGMAALLPGKALSITEKMDVLLDGQPTGSTLKRGALLADPRVNGAALTYQSFIRMSQQERRDACSGKDVIYIYHDAIDALGDARATETEVFKGCQSAITEIKSVVDRILNDLSGIHVLITADHGFLYNYEPLEEIQKIGRQIFDGESYEIGRRYALVAPETTADYLLPIKTDLEIGEKQVKGYAPQDIVRIKIQGGGENYVHGGISLQEMVVPVIVYKGMRSGYKKYVEVQNPGLSLISESRKISNLMFSIKVMQQLPVGEKVQPSSYKLQFTDDQGIPVSDLQTVIADRTSANASKRVFQVRFTLKQQAYDRNKIYRLVMANDIDPPQELEYNIDIAFADDFGFDL